MAVVTQIPATKNLFTTKPTSVKQKRRVAGYARVSTDKDEQFTSYEAQVEYYTDYIRRNPDWDFVKVYTDEGITGTSTKKREGFNEMVNDALAGKIDLIVTKSVSRFARNTVDSLVTIRDLKAHGVEVFFEKENIYTFAGKGEYNLYFMPETYWDDAISPYKEKYTKNHAKPKWGTFDTALPDTVNRVASIFLETSKDDATNNFGYETVPLRERSDEIAAILHYLYHDCRLKIYISQALDGAIDEEAFGKKNKGILMNCIKIKNYEKFYATWQSTGIFNILCEFKLPVIPNNQEFDFENEKLYFKKFGDMTLYEVAKLAMRMGIVIEESDAKTTRVLESINRQICEENGKSYIHEDHPIKEWIANKLFIENIWGSHCMENYMSYIDVSGTDYRTHRRHENGEQDIVKEARISCPVDVEVYDAQNNLVGRIIQNVVDDSVDSMVDLAVDGDTKIVRMYADQNHYIKIIGNDDGTMNYTVSEYDETGAKTRQVNFFDIPVENGKTISGTVNDELDTPIENYYLTMPSGSTVTESENLTDDAIDSITISTGSVGHGFAFGDGVFTSGDNVTLYAFPNEGEEFLGWYADDSLVSEEATYSFIARASGEYTAKFTTLVEKDPDDRISATITDQITVNFLLDLDVRENPQVITVRHLSPVGEELETLTFEADKLTRDSKTGLYRLSIPVAPAQGADRYELSIDGTPIVQDIYSVKDYCNYIIANGSSPAYSMYVNLAKAMLEYCEAANEYFDYTAEFAGTEDAQKAITDVAGLENHMSINANGKIQSISYMAVTKPEFRFYVSSDSGLTETDFVALNDKITVTGGNGKVTVKFVKNAETGAILLEVTGIEAATMNEIITITIVGFGAITFCGNDFARLLAKNDSTATLGAALYLYGVNAKACFSSTGA